MKDAVNVNTKRSHARRSGTEKSARMSHEYIKIWFAARNTLLKALASDHIISSIMFHVAYEDIVTDTIYGGRNTRRVDGHRLSVGDRLYRLSA